MHFVYYMRRSVKILFWDHHKISYERRGYELMYLKNNSYI